MTTNNKPNRLAKENWVFVVGICRLVTDEMFAWVNFSKKLLLMFWREFFCLKVRD